MDGNGNNSSKVSTLRQHFENYDKIEQRRASDVASTIYSSNNTVSVGLSTKSVERSKKSNSEPPPKRTNVGTGNNNNRGRIIGSSDLNLKGFTHGLAEQNSLNNNSSSRPPTEKDLLMSISVVSSTPEAGRRRGGGGGQLTDNRNAIYGSNSLAYEKLDSSNSGGGGTSKNKRRGLVILDPDDMIPVHPSSQEVLDDEGYLVQDDELDEDADDMEHDDDPTVETSIPIAFDRHDEVHGDGLSIASNSTTSSHHSFNYGHVKNQNHSGRVGDGVNKNEKASVITSNHNNSNGPGGPRDSGSKANTPTSSSSCSSGSGGCGKVKRRNAFRHKDVSSFPTSAAAGDGSSSAILAAVAKTKVAVERVKSLDSATTNVTPSSHSSIAGQINNSSHVKIKNVNVNASSNLVSNSTGKSVSGRSGSASEIMVPSKMGKGKGNGSLISAAGVGIPCSSESSKKNDKGILVSDNPHDPNTSSNNGSKGSPAQRAASLCVRTTNNSSTPNNSIRSSQLYEPCVNSAFVRNNGANNHPSHLHHVNHPHYPQQLHPHQLQSNNNSNNHNNNNHGGGVNAPDNLSNNSINSNSSSASSQKAINVVTPYLVTDIYNQIKISDSSSYSNPNGSSSNKKKKQQQQLKQLMNEVEYAVPMIPNQRQEQRLQQQQPQQRNKGDHSSIQQKQSSSSEIPPKVPPPPLNYPPSSVRKEQFGLPSPNSSYTFLPQRNAQGTMSASSSSPYNMSGNKRPTNDTTPVGMNVKEKEPRKGANAPSGPPEKPPRTFLYNHNQGPHTSTRGSPPTSVGLPSASSSSSQAKRQHSSSSSSSTLTSGTDAKLVHSYLQQMSPASLPAQEYNNSPSSLSVSKATVRQTNTVTNRNPPSSSSKSHLPIQTSEPLYTATRNKKKDPDSGSNVSNGTKGTSSSSSKSSSVTVVRSNVHHHQHHHHVHPPLVRSKTESQLVVKSKKGNPNRFLNRPSEGGLGYGVEMMSLEPGRQHHNHFHQDLLVDATHPTTTLAHVNSGMASLSAYYNSPPVHHQSQTNLMALTGHKIYEQQQYRSINNLLRYTNTDNGGAGAGGGMQANKYPSNPGLHYASRELSWLENGLPPVTSSVGNAGSNYNIYSGAADNHHQGNHSNQTPRHNSSLMYTTNIDISPRDKRLDISNSRQAPSSSANYSDGTNHGDPLQQQKQPQSLYGVLPSDNSLSVQHQLQSNNQFNNHYVHHPLYQYRLSERSKSEWALNAVQCASESGGRNNSINNFRAGGSNASDKSPAMANHRQHSNNQISSRSIPNNNNGSIDPTSNECPSLPPHLMGRRATVATTGSSSSIANSSHNMGGSGNPGHPSLDSSVSSPNHSNNSSLSNMQRGSVKGHNRHHHHHHANVPNSIQHLVNQLFSSTTIKDATSSTDSGIQLGSESLSSCDTPIGDSTTDTGDSDCENEGDTSNSARKVVEARKGYVRRVSSVRVQELGESLHRLIQSSKVVHNIDPLFECLLVVGLDRDPSNGIYHPYIREKFPRDAKLAEGVEQFCFPDSLEWPCHEGSTAQFYTLAITDQRGGRKFGYCFRILPEGASFCIPITYCIISSHRAIGFYREVLKEITGCHGHSEYQRRHFLQELYKKSFPAPGSSISVTEPTLEETYVQNDHVGYGITGSSPKTVTIRRRADHRLDEGDLVTLVSTVDLSIVIKVFGSLLLERKVVLLSRALSTLSLCIEALESLLYPFNWQHTFVPILPLDMTDVIDAPAPFLIGVLRSSRTAWDKTLDDGIVVDLDVDNGKIISCVGDEGTILPKRIHRKLRNALSQLVIDLADQKESTKNVLISECFIRMFVETLGHYSNHIVTKPDGTKAFERESFVKSSESKATQNFLEWFSETSMFNEFIELKLKSPNQHGLFEQRVMEQIESGPIVHGSGNGGTPLKKDIWVKMKGPFGTWLKETFKQ